ncbi:TRAP transporter large permease subunit [Siculibacillus lacustris]|uniref:TRAP transporter large permease subunit n=1 Tax=Siculibacillus lacustris TaxID=1549641 RepID=A0A4Q9VX54_9HYPH|nr:TRAP transporter large permease subunit [Siculibacillus lacustris]TBW40851.1 TRAP transporter large permease subunit [Siculibacillus lacustris]
MNNANPSDLSSGGFAALKAACGRLERGIALVTEVPGAILVVVEVVVLFAGVTFRYGLHKPLVWSDELASILFLWLCMLGAVVAQHRGAHMRLTVIAGLLKAPWRARIETISSAAVILFLGLTVAPALEHAVDQMLITTPALHLPDAVRSAAILTGTTLMLVIAVLQLIQTSKLLDVIIAVVLIAVCGGLLQLFLPQLQDMENWNLVVFFGIGVTALVLGGAPIAFAFGLATTVYLRFMTFMPESIVISRMDEGMSTFVLLSIPLFVLLGLLIEVTGIAAALVNLLVVLVGHFKGGLSYVLIGAMYLVSGISGSKAADMAAIAPVLLPEMQRRGKEPGELIGLLSSSAAMAETIPPSIVLITVGSVTGVSIAALFTGGLLPAAVGALGLVLVAFLRSRREDVTHAERASWNQIVKALVTSIPALLLLALIRWAVVSGVATATEVSTLGVVYTVLVAVLVFRRFPLDRVWPMLCDTLALSGAIMIILGCATAMAWALTQSGFSQQLAHAMAQMPGGAAGFMALSIVVFAVLGSVLEGIPAIVVFAPLLFPIAHDLGIDPVHYAIMMVLSMSLGLFTPPLGIGFYQACAIGRVDPDKAMRAIWPYMTALFVAAIIVAAVPWLSRPHL